MAFNDTNYRIGYVPGVAESVRKYWDEHDESPMFAFMPILIGLQSLQKNFDTTTIKELRENIDALAEGATVLDVLLHRQRKAQLFGADDD